MREPGPIPNGPPELTRHPATGSGATWPIYEVFRQERQGQPMQHAGNLTAPDSDMAELYAREFYGRRNESIRIWVVPRAEVREIVDADLLHPPAVDRSYRLVGGYTVRDKLDQARAHGEDNIPGSPGRKARPAAPRDAMEIPSDV